MRRFVQVVPTEGSINPAAFMAKYGVSFAEAQGMVDQFLSEKVFVNGVYQVAVSAPFASRGALPPMVHLSIIPLDGLPVHSWSDLQAIKNELIGPEYEAVEIYPAESRLVDMGSNYHLWVFADKDFQFPIGWKKRMVASDTASYSEATV